MRLSLCCALVVGGCQSEDTTYVGAESSFWLAWAFSAGSFVAGLPAVVYAASKLGWEGPLGSRPDDMMIVLVVTFVVCFGYVFCGRTIEKEQSQNMSGIVI